MKPLLLCFLILVIAGCSIIRDNPLDKKGENYDPVYLYQNAVYLSTYFIHVENPTVQVMVKNIPQNISTMHIAFQKEVLVKSAKLLYTEKVLR